MTLFVTTDTNTCPMEMNQKMNRMGKSKAFGRKKFPGDGYKCF